MQRKIAVLGCGWLGLPLAKSFIEKGYQVNGATTSVDKILNLAQHNINPFLIAIHMNHIEGNISYFLQNTDVLVICIPPRVRQHSECNYVSKIRVLSEKITLSDVKKVIFISSSSVYANDNTIVNDDTIPQPQTESGKQILAAENLLKESSNFETTVIRFAGLYGMKRHPVNQLSGKKNILNPEAPVNLIHLNDCIGIINAVIAREAWGKTFNAAAPHHPSKKEYYIIQTHKQGIPPPKFDHKQKTQGKTITSTFVNTYLAYNFLHPNLDY
ncbi:SDR family NAD(P)-dependent oxidoreductase [Galbibacter sp. EGI 63066]|uniref:NAD(P)-binding domain-containing protein n=1 Tax=Galbibacter sp. EGI 63066 TaxID=2993559 RepID=UPI002249684D|nr:NAD(P)-binding domain-containing protein [Galbibacter sp. EGI 63066]MCX2680951.1 SDR family NAD(P)-dependent oxidoreductase [Galbibacter sp. EGI 63066]